IWKNVPSQYWRYDKQRHTLTFNDNTYIDFRSADRPENWEGFGYDLIILNEAGIILTDEDLYHKSVRPMTMDYDADMIIGGTPKGAGGLFEQLCNKGYDPNEPKYETHHYTSWDNPLIEREVIADLETSYPEQVAQQEIYGKFISDSGVVFRNIET